MHCAVFVALLSWVSCFEQYLNVCVCVSFENIYNYKLTASKQEAFFRSASRFLPFLEFDDISPEMAGIRPKIQKPGEPLRDFYIMEESKRGYPGFINLIGMESPGLTSSLSIAKYVNDLIKNII